MQHPIRAVTIFIGLTLAALPTLAPAQEGGAVSEAALTMPALQIDTADEHHGRGRRGQTRAGKEAEAGDASSRQDRAAEGRGE